MKKFPILLLFLIASTITAYGATYTLVSANYPINVNGQKIAVEPLNYNGVTYLPIRAISEAVGVPITWNNATRSVEITTLDIEKLKESCVMIYADDGKTQTQGSGTYWDYGKILTAYHIVDEGRTNIKTSQGVKLTVDESNPTLDASILNAPLDVKPVKIGDSDEVKVGDKVILITSPKGKENTVTYGTVIETKIDGLTRFAVWANLDNGSSGGSCFDTFGSLIGIIVSGEDKLHLVVPINDIRKVL